MSVVRIILDHTKQNCRTNRNRPIGLHGIVIRLLRFEQFEVFLEYANLDRELG